MRLRGSAAEQPRRALLGELDMSSRADAYPAQMSGGRKQRVAIAQALASGTAVVLASEPTASLDGASG